MLITNRWRCFRDTSSLPASSFLRLADRVRVDGLFGCWLPFLSPRAFVTLGPVSFGAVRSCFVSRRCAANRRRLMRGAFISRFRLHLIKSHAGEKIIDLPEDTPYSFPMIDASFPFIPFPSLLAGTNRIKDKTRSMCRRPLRSIY